MTAKKTAKPRAKKAETVEAIKGFDSELKCLGFAYEVGKTYEHTGPVRLCSSGFHSIEGNPLDVLDYYPIIGGFGSLNRFCSVVASGEIGRDGTSKIVSGKLSVSVELTIPDLIRKSVAFVIDACKASKKEAVQAASGNSSQLAASGDYSQLAASGNSSQLAASGDYSQLAASGNHSKLAASGDSSQLAASGDSSQLAASGDYSQLAASGYHSKLAASGDSSQLAASGNHSQLAASGYHSQLAASGNHSKLAASGENSVIAAAAPHCTATGADGTWISLAEFDRNGKCVGFATGCIGKDGLKPNTAYIARDGKLVEAGK